MWTSFIGFMGCGKTTLSRRLHELSSRPLVELDALVAEGAGRSVPEIFATEGEAGFRDREMQALQGLDPSRRLIVDCGGGVVLSPGAGPLLRVRGVVIWLDCGFEAIRARLEGTSGQRPLLDRLGWDGLRRLHAERRPLYAAAADFRLRTDLGSGEQLVRQAMLRSLQWQREEEERR